MSISIDYSDGPLSIRKHAQWGGTDASFHVREGDELKAQFYSKKASKDPNSHDFFIVGAKASKDGDSLGCETSIYLSIADAKALHTKLGEALVEEMKANVEIGELHEAHPKLPADWRCPRCKVREADVNMSGLVTCKNGHESN